MFVVSYLSEVPDYTKISGLTFGTITSKHKKDSRASWNYWDIALSALVILLILAAYLYFVG